MFIIEDTQLERAIERAKDLHPKVRMVRFGEYVVSGSKAGADYVVKCFRAAGQKIVACSCPTKNGIACKHGVAAASLHVGLARQRMA
jgi:glutamate dehydrogenase/leucine dehydrogenase